MSLVRDKIFRECLLHLTLSGFSMGLGSIGRMTAVRSLCEESSMSFAFDVCTVHRSLRINRGFELGTVYSLRGRLHWKFFTRNAGEHRRKTELRNIVKSENGKIQWKKGGQNDSLRRTLYYFTRYDLQAINVNLLARLIIADRNNRRTQPWSR